LRLSWRRRIISAATDHPFGLTRETRQLEI